ERSAVARRSSKMRRVYLDDPTRERTRRRGAGSVHETCGTTACERRLRATAGSSFGRRGIDVVAATLTVVIGTLEEGEIHGGTHADWLRDSCLVIIPALNEEATIADVVRNVRRQGFSRIRVIDNGSGDATASRARAAGAEVLTEPHCGYGQACRRGL